MSNILEIKLSSNGLFGNPKIIKVKEYSFSQIHEIVDAYDMNNMTAVLDIWIKIMAENTLEPEKVDFGNFTIDELTEVLIICHLNFVNTGVSTWVTFEKSEDRMVSLGSNDIKFDTLELEDHEKDLNRITIQKGEEPALVGTPMRVIDMRNAFQKSFDFKKEHKAKFYESYRVFELAREGGREDKVTDKIKKIIDDGREGTRRILNDSLVASMIVSYGENIPKNLDEKIKLLSIIPPGPILVLEEVITTKFYHGPSKAVNYEGDNGRCSFQLPHIIQALRTANSKDYEISLG